MNAMSDELLVEILSCIPKTEQRKTFLNLSRTSRRLNALTEPSIYHDYHYTYHVDKPVRLLASSLASNPRLALHLKSITLENWQFQRYPLGGWTILSSPQSQSQDTLLSVVDQFQFPVQFAEKLKQELKDGLDDAHIGLMLLLTPNIETLRLVLPYYIVEKRELSILRCLKLAMNMAVNTRPFTILRTLELDSANRRDGFRLHPFMPIFRLPSMRTFRASHCLEKGPMDDWEQIEENCFIENIKFSESELSTHAIERMLDACKALKLFQYEWKRLELWEPGCTWERNPLLDYGRLDRALRRHKNSLEDLQLSLQDSATDHNGSTELRVQSCMRSLSQFINLKTISVNPNALLGFGASTRDDFHESMDLRDVLPLSLEYLRFNYWEAVTPRDWRFEYLGKDWWNFFPKLKVVEIYTHDGQGEGWDTLGIHLQGYGIQLKISPL